MKTKLFPDVKSILADKMTNEIVGGLATEITAHYQAAKKNNLPPQSAHVAALDALAIVTAHTLKMVVPKENHSEAISEFMNQLEVHLFKGVTK